MSRDDAKRALETIEILKAHNTYTEADAIGIINNLMKRSFADGKQYVKDQQQNKKEYWTMIYNNGKYMSSSKDSKESAIRHMTELREENPGQWDEAYVTKVTEVMDNEEYRIKPEPRMLWVYPMGDDGFEATTIKKNAKNYSGVFKAIEVLEDD